MLLQINDLPDYHNRETRCRLIAGNCLLYCAVNSLKRHLKPQQDLKNLDKWASNRGMCFNAIKCYMMSTSHGRTPSKYIMYEMCGGFQSCVDTNNYLSVTILQDLSWDPHLTKAAITVNQKLGFLKRNFKGCPADNKKMVYLSSVRLSLKYAAIIWEPHLEKHKTLQRKAALWIQYDCTSSVIVMLQSLQLETLQEGRKASRLTFVFTIINERVAVPMTDLVLERNK